MNKTLVCIVFSLFVCSLTAQTEYVTNEEAGFRVKAPGAFEEKYQQVSTDIGLMDLRTYYHQPEIEEPINFLYLINYVEYPEGTLHHDSLAMVEDLFANSMEEFNLSVGGKVMYQTPFMKDSPPNSIFRIEYDEGFKIVKAKMIVHENKFYFLQVFTTKPHSLNNKIDEFLDSFSLRPRKSN